MKLWAKFVCFVKGHSLLESDAMEKLRGEWVYSKNHGYTKEWGHAGFRCERCGIFMSNSEYMQRREKYS